MYQSKRGRCENDAQGNTTCVFDARTVKPRAESQCLRCGNFADVKPVEIKSSSLVSIMGWLQKMADTIHTGCHLQLSADGQAIETYAKTSHGLVRITGQSQ